MASNLLIVKGGWIRELRSWVQRKYGRRVRRERLHIEVSTTIDPELLQLMSRLERLPWQMREAAKLIREAPNATAAEYLEVCRQRNEALEELRSMEVERDRWIQRADQWEARWRRLDRERQGLDRVDQADPIEAYEPTAECRVCMVCGCTDERACPGGCSWVAPNLCSACAVAAAFATVSPGVPYDFRNKSDFERAMALLRQGLDPVDQADPIDPALERAADEVRP